MANSVRGIVSGNTNVAEISPALANFNFDFTLYRVEAPAEFQGVGRALTRVRRAEAESGQSHITARVLGALFTSALPKTPNLIRVYGLRASEISKRATEDSSKTQSWGFFADHSGADGTTIWASATSGPDSIPAHLLACLLARVWDPPEAISIWVEIVRRRREIILADFDKSNIADIRDVWAAKHPISRDHLAEWDNSARSWLRTADRVKEREQKQVLLIFDNIEQEIRSDRGTFESVLSTWQEALTFFEAIVSGISQKAGNGQSLLALCAWHLYPELMVVDPSPRETKQNDTLMPAKVIVTIGLGKKPGQKDGICWSLPLAYFRHYGPAVKRESVVNSTQRLSVEEFEMAFFGTFIIGWTQLGVSVVQIAHWLRSVHHVLLQKSGTTSPAGELLEACQRFSWLGILFDSSSRYLASVHSENHCDRQLVRLGQVHGQSFLGEAGDPFFGLCLAGAYMDCFKTEEDSIAHLREIASKLPEEANSMFIRVRHTCHEVDGGAVFEYLTAKPMLRRSTERDLKGSQLVITKHCRWMYKGGDIVKHTDEKCYIRRLLKWDPERFHGIWPQLDQEKSEKLDGLDSGQTFTDPIEEFFRRIVIDESGWAKESRPPLNLPATAAADRISLDFHQRQTICNSMGEDVQLREDNVIEDYRSKELGVFWTTYSDPPLPSKSCWYRKVYGSHSAALYVLESALERNKTILKEISMQRFLGLFDTDLVDPDKLATLLVSSVHRHRGPKRVASLKAVSTAANIYRGLSNATIDVRVLQQDLSKMHWMDDHRHVSGIGLFFPAVLSLPSVFSCICFFESGRFNIEISALCNVMAMSTADNIWVAYQLLDDPYSTLEGFDAHPTFYAYQTNTGEEFFEVMDRSVTAFTGNVGRPGISFLVPPKEPMIRPSCIYDFRQIVHEPFDGNLSDDFHDTSLHLSFTSAKSDVSGYFEGLKDSELEVVETALSVYERDKWVADLDVIKSIDNTFIHRIFPCPDCEQKRKRSGGMPHRGLIGENKPGVTAITNWTELLDPPETKYSIVKASGNWEARLAAFVIAIASGHQACVLPDTWCWTCVGKSEAEGILIG